MKKFEGGVSVHNIENNKNQPEKFENYKKTVNRIVMSKENGHLILTKCIIEK